jgi:hypothetical protein
MKSNSIKAIMLAAVLFMSVFAIGMASASPQDWAPEAVKAAFRKDYPNVSDQNVDWDKEDGMYEAHFKVQNEKMIVTYSPNGVLLATESEVSLSAVPEAVIKSVKNMHPNKKPTVYTKVVRGNGAVLYRNRTGGHNMLFTPEGAITK